MLKMYFACLSALAVLPASAQPTVYASGLKNPSKIIVIPNGNLLVTEVDVTPNSGRVTRIAPGGSLMPLISGLPSGLSAPNSEPDGTNGLALSGRTLYVDNGEGDSYVNGTAAGTILPNPKGPSSPLFASILQVTFTNDVDQLTAGFTLKLQDHFTLLDGTPVTIDNGSGDKATFQLLTAFRPGIPDPISIYRNSHPYGVTLYGPQPDSLFVNDAGMNLVYQVSLSTGRSHVLTRFPNIPSPLPAGSGPPAVEAVPTSITPYGNVLLVSLLSGFPFVPGLSAIMAVDPVTGAASPFIGGLTSTTSVLYRTKEDGSNQWFALEFSLNLGASSPPPGRLVSYTTPLGVTLADGLVTPTSMAVDPSSGTLYVTSLALGSVWQLDVGK